MSRLRVLVVLLLSAGLVLGWGPLSVATAAGTTARAVADAELRWGMSNEANNAAFAPGTMNFLGAGKLPNPGKGGHAFTEAEWSQRVGNASIEKAQPGGGYAAATWAGLRTDANGTPITSPTSGRFSGHQAVLENGTGWADPETGRAVVSWDADFTVVLYSGLSFFYVSDPMLAVHDNGTGTLTGTLSGYAASRDDPDVWEELEPTVATLATLRGVTVGESGLVTTPKYAGVTYDSADPDAPAQVRSGSGWGAWPTTFVDFQVLTGQSSYWYSSGGSTDAYKSPLPLTTGYTLGGVLAEDPQVPGEPGDPDPDDPDPDDPDPDDPDPDDPDDPDPDDPDAEPGRKAFTVDDAQLRWGINDESNNSAFAPGTANFFSAGKVPDPGTGGQLLDRSDWRAGKGTVRIEKRAAGGDYARATWDGLKTTPDGTPLGSPTNGLFSDHQVVLDGGQGEVDPKAGTATIRWKGSFTVLYYSGMTFFYVADPVLKVTPKKSLVTAVLSGFGSDRDDTSTWKKIKPKRVTIANLPKIAPSRGKGLTFTPKYAGVSYDAPAGGIEQVKGEHYGAFPSSFLGYMAKVGSAAYWYSSGGSTDAYKEPLPMTVSYEAGDPIATPADDDEDETADDERSGVLPPPSLDPPPSSGAGSAALRRSTPTETVTTAAAPLMAPYQPPTLYGQEAVPDLVAADVTATTAADWRWWLGGGLLLTAALLMLLPLPRKETR